MADIDLAALVGSNIRTARRAADLTQGELAEKVGLTSFMAVSRWETGRGSPSGVALVRLSEVLGHEVAWFYTEHEAQRSAV